MVTHNRRAAEQIKNDHVANIVMDWAKFGKSGKGGNTENSKSVVAGGV